MSNDSNNLTAVEKVLIVVIILLVVGIGYVVFKGEGSDESKADVQVIKVDLEGEDENPVQVK